MHGQKKTYDTTQATGGGETQLEAKGACVTDRVREARSLCSISLASEKKKCEVYIDYKVR